MQSTLGVHLSVFLFIATAIVVVSSLPRRRTFSFYRDNDLPRRHYEELIATRQIRNGLYSGAPSEENNSMPAEEPVAGSLKFHEKPPSQVVVQMYDRLELVCVVSGAPPPAVYWLKNGQPIREAPFEIEETNNKIMEAPLKPSRGLASTKSRMVIDCVDGEAEAIYTCVAESTEEKVISSTYVHIEGEAPYNETTCNLRRDLLPASIFMWSGTYIDVEGRDAVLLCRAAGHPAPKITWVDNEDRRIVNGLNNYRILPTGDLLIRGLRWKDHMGLYKCRAENKLGQDESTTFLYPVVPES